MLRELPWHFYVDHCHEANGDLHLSVMAIDLGRELEKGDKLNAGFFVQNSESGNCETLACSRVFRVACENGALLECEKGQSFEISAANKPPANWQTKIQHVVNRSFDSHGLDLDLARFRATTEQGTDIVLKQADQGKDVKLSAGDHTLVVQRGDFTFETNKLVLSGSRRLTPIPVSEIQA